MGVFLEKYVVKWGEIWIIGWKGNGRLCYGCENKRGVRGKPLKIHYY